MGLFLIIIISFIYIMGILAYIDIETMENAKFHKGGFLGLGYITNSNRKINVKDSRMSLLWPALSVFWFVKTSLWIFHDCFSFIILLSGFDYKNTKMYKYIDKKLYS